MNLKSEDGQTPLELPSVPSSESVPGEESAEHQTYHLDGNSQLTLDSPSRPPNHDPFLAEQTVAGADQHGGLALEGSQVEPVAAEDVAEEDAGPSGWEITKAVIREIVETVILTLIIFFLIQSVIRNFRVDGHSMDPNLHHGQYLVVDKISYKLPFEWRPPQRGDVVVFEPPTRPDDDFVKRVIGLPGETVEIKQGDIYINNERLAESYLPRQDRFTMSARTVPEDAYFVMGDNRGNSNDSRHWGFLNTDKLVGKAWLSYWPPETWGVIPNDAPTGSATLFSLFSQWSGQADQTAN